MRAESHKVLHGQTGKTVEYLPASESSDANAMRQYVTSDTGELPSFTKFMDEETYKQALSSLPVACVDVVIYDPATGRVLVGNRDQEPQAGDWVIGGRMKTGESQHQAAMRNLTRELGGLAAAMAKDRLVSIGKAYSLVWDTREQGDTTNEEGEIVTGCHMVSLPMALPLAEAEFDAIAAPNEEYTGLRWEDGFELYEAPAGDFHPAHQDMVFDTLECVATMPATQTALS